MSMNNNSRSNLGVESADLDNIKNKSNLMRLFLLIITIIQQDKTKFSTECDQQNLSSEFGVSNV